MKKFIYGTFAFLFAAAAMQSCGGNDAKDFQFTVIPAPQSVEIEKSGAFKVPSHLLVSFADNSSLMPAASYLAERLSPAYDVTVTNDVKGDILLRLDEREDNGSYSLEVTKNGVTITAGGYSGIIYGISTFRQLLPAGTESRTVTAKGAKAVIPAMKIADAPRFAWRGLHMDVSRHFFDKQEVKRFLDVMAAYKLNKFHWHLTDDQGWRLEIKKHPLLTEQGAWRDPATHNHDRVLTRQAEAEDNSDKLLPEKFKREMNGKTVYGGYFTQDDIREIVAYATMLGIDIVPEVDIPGHSLMAINSYPYLSCFEKGSWGNVFSSPLCPGKDTTLEFYKNIYTELFDLFPYKYIHLGADEVDMTNWKKCPHCQKRIKDHKLGNETELHAWFVREMEKFFNEHGRIMIGWDEIADGTLSDTAVLMWWRNWMPRNYRKAMMNGNPVIITNNVAFYFDYAQDKYAMTRIYNYDPWDKRYPEWNEEQKKNLLGMQGNNWAEWIPSWDRLGYQAFPRALALSELTWTLPENKDEEDFNRRVTANYERLDALGMNYKLPLIEGYHEVNAFIGSTDVTIDYPLDNAIIRYTTDGSMPKQDSPEFTSPMSITETTDLTLRLFRKAGNKPDDITRYRFVKSEYAAPAEVKGELSTGLKAVWHNVRAGKVADIDKAPVQGSYVIDGIAIPKEVRGNIGLIFDGYINVPADGIYTFWLNSDDGSTFMIDDEMVIDNDGAHSPCEKIGQKALRKGLHKVHARYFDYNGGTLQFGIIDDSGKKLMLNDLGWFKH